MDDDRDDTQSEFKPDWCSPPGGTLEDILEAKNWTHAHLAVLTGLDTGVVDDLIAGAVELTPDIAERLERALEGRPSAAFWLKREEHFREGLAQGLTWV